MLINLGVSNLEAVLDVQQLGIKFKKKENKKLFNPQTGHMTSNLSV